MNLPDTEHLKRPTIPPEAAAARIYELFEAYRDELTNPDPMLGPGNIQGKLAFEAVTEETSKERLHYQATHDHLTGLLNRSGLGEFLANNEPPKAVLVVDGNNVKAVNDTLGHDRGDRLLTDFAQVLRQSVRPNDIIARTGGDEFVVIFDTTPGLRDSAHEGNKKHTPELTPAELVEVTTARITEKAREFSHFEDNADLAQHGLNLGMSVGGAVWQEGMATEQLLRAADFAMYSNKPSKD